MGRYLPGSVVVPGGSIGRRSRVSADRWAPAERNAGEARPAPARWHSIRIPPGTVRSAVRYFAEGTRRSGWCPVSVRRRAGKRRGCRPAAVPAFPGFPAKKQDLERRCRRPPLSQDSEQFGALSCPILLSDSPGVHVRCDKLLHPRVENKRGRRRFTPDNKM